MHMQLQFCCVWVYLCLDIAKGAWELDDEEMLVIVVPPPKYIDWHIIPVFIEL